jgi:hypothetical protein
LTCLLTGYSSGQTALTIILELRWKVVRGKKLTVVNLCGILSLFSRQIQKTEVKERG